mmetsp:Transcript_37940/g.100889  ORF Transcript_37940/g.100889 Transcript_37940/m.100889 type:complete len:105 (+) Transcript_37940:242-556(+)
MRPPACRIEESAEHPLRYHELYMQYTSMLEQKLEAFLVENASSVPELLARVAAASGQSHTCVDYLLASTEYSAFLNLMLDFSSLSQWDASVDERDATVGLENGQ